MTDYGRKTWWIVGIATIGYGVALFAAILNAA